MTTRRILATSGGFMGTDRYEARKPAGLFLEALRLSGKDRPRVLFVMTASGDNNAYVAGDHRDTASIQGALVSGRRIGDAVVAALA